MMIGCNSLNMRGEVDGGLVLTLLGLAGVYTVYCVHDLTAYGSGEERVKNIEKLQALKLEKALFERGQIERKAAFEHYQDAVCFFKTAKGSGNVLKSNEKNVTDLLFVHYCKIADLSDKSDKSAEKTGDSALQEQKV